MKSLSTKLTALMLAICIVGMGLVAAAAVALAYNSLLEESLERVANNTAQEAARIDGWLQAQMSFIDAFALDMAYIDEYTKENILPITNAHVDAHAHYFDVYLGYPDGIVMFASGMEPDYAAGWSSTKRPWYVGAMEVVGQTAITAPYTDVQTGGLCISVSKTVMKSGQVAAVAAVDILIDQLYDIVGATSVGQDSYAFLVDAEGGLLIHPNPSYGPDADDNFQNLSQIESGWYQTLWNNTALGNTSYRMKNDQGVSSYYTAHTIDANGWKLYTVIPASVISAPINRLLLIELCIFAVVIAAAVVMILAVTKKVIVRPVREITRAADKISNGSFDIQMTSQNEDEIGRLAESFRTMSGRIHEQVEVIRRISDGDLTVQIPVHSQEDVLGHALEQLSGSLNKMVSSIAVSAEHVSGGSKQISANAQTLAQGATEQAGSVQELSESLAGVVKHLKENEEKTKTTSTVSNEIAVNAQKGSQQMNRMIQAVTEINEASQSIGKVIKVIDDIAFQTNILALNAAIEAARAGVHGKGFAVVADEVRTLAAKSAEAASDTSLLIENSIQKSELGAQIAKETGQSFQEIIDGIGHTANLAAEINEATREQAAAISKIDIGIEQVSQVASLNAATSEECAAASQELTNESVRLSGIVGNFKLLGKITPPAAPALPNGEDAMEYFPTLDDQQSKY